MMPACRTVEDGLHDAPHLREGEGAIDDDFSPDAGTRADEAEAQEDDLPDDG